MTFSQFVCECSMRLYAKDGVIRRDAVEAAEQLAKVLQERGHLEMPQAPQVPARPKTALIQCGQCRG
jgi:hypothetical protein